MRWQILSWNRGHPPAHVPTPLKGSKRVVLIDMLPQAQARGFQPACVLFDRGYASGEHVKVLRRYGWHGLTRRKRNRLVHPEGQGNRPICHVDIPPEGRVVHLRGYGFITVFRTVSPQRSF